MLAFIARVLTQTPEPRTHGVRYFGAYSSRARAYRKKRHVALQPLGGDDNATPKHEPELSPKKRAAMRKSWAQLIRRVYLTDPLKCECGGNLRVVAFILDKKPFEKSWIISKTPAPTPALLQRHSFLPTSPSMPFLRNPRPQLRLPTSIPTDLT